MLELIDLDIPDLGYTRFISAWLYQGHGGVFLVDPGPACTIPALLKALENRNIDHLDWILLTHIHLDHAGGIGHLVQRFKKARVVCHERAGVHLEDPSRLWEGSLKVLGDVAKTYGKMEAVPAQNLVCASEVDFEDGIRVISTPGHAVHHQCYIFKEWIFSGELFGVMLIQKDCLYLRPATPARIDLNGFFESMERMGPEIHRKICFGHYGQFPEGPKILAMAKSQLSLWVDVIRQQRNCPDVKRIMQTLMDRDPVYANMRHLPASLLDRETFFSINAINGILQAVRSES